MNGDFVHAYGPTLIVKKKKKEINKTKQIKQMKNSIPKCNNFTFCQN